MAFEELKERQSLMWGNGRFELVSETAADVHDAVVESLAPRPGTTWLDVACGTGAVAQRAAAAGAEVTGIDLAPALIETAQRLASEAGLEIDYRVGDAENLDLPDASFDVVSSTFGVMFAPDHPRAASELARVTGPGGRLGLATWTAEGGIGRQFAMTAQFQPPPPEGAGDPLAWGREEHVRDLLGDAFDLRFERRVSTYTAPSAEDYWQLIVTNLGPVKTLAESMDEERREEFHAAWVDFFESNFRSNGSIVHDREWLLTLGTRR
jgi:ubiquinone/menaquinone biosynthesis C-methylase UbiE